MTKKTADNEQQLELKKRARRRLVGAVVFVSVAAVVLPLVMDEEPPQVAGIELHIPGQEKGYTPPPASLPVSDKPLPAPAAEPVVPPAIEPTVNPATVGINPVAAKPDEKAATAKPEGAAKPIEAAQPVGGKTPFPAGTVAKPAPVVGSDGKRAQAILDGKTDKKAASGQYVILIGAFSNQANVAVLQKKIGELGIRVFTEPLDTPQGKKTRVRAGPFVSRDAADQAATRIKKIGVSGVVAAKS